MSFFSEEKAKLLRRIGSQVEEKNQELKYVYLQGCHVSGKSQGKTKFSPGQGIVREF